MDRPALKGIVPWLGDLTARKASQAVIEQCGMALWGATRALGLAATDGLPPWSDLPMSISRVTRPIT